MVHIPHTHRHHEKIPGRNPKRRKNMLSLFAALVQRNQFGTTQRYKLLHGTFKAAVSDVSEHFHMHLRGGLNLYTSGQKYLSLQWQLWGYKLVYPPHKTPEIHPIQASVPHLQETALPLELSHRKTNRGRLFVCNATMRVLWNPQRGD